MKYKNLIMFMVITSLLTISNIKVEAASASINVSNNEVFIGDTFTVNVNVSSIAAWNIHVNSVGPVSNCSIDSADATADAMDTDKTFTVTCNTTGEGIIDITLSGDVTSAKTGIAEVISDSKSVKVVKKEEPPKPKEEVVEEKEEIKEETPVLSSNNNIESITIEGYELTKIDNNNYSLDVTKEVDNINIDIVLEDDKSKVSGDGNHKLALGENKIELIVTAENNEENIIYITINRKEFQELSNLNSLLSSNNNNLDIKLNTNDKLTSKDIDNIIKSKKIVNLNYFNEDNKLLYKIILDGKKIINNGDFDPTINIVKSTESKIKEKINYVDGIFISLKYNVKLPSNIKIKLYTGNYFAKQDNIKIYSYYHEKDRLDIYKDNINVSGEYIDFELDDSREYLLTKANLIPVKKKTNFFKIFFITETLILLGVISYIYCKKKGLFIKDGLNKKNLVEENILDKDKIISSKEEVISTYNLPNEEDYIDSTDNEYKL